ncbi:hypothetical protein LIA77_10190 [Sarocladium implicatum]|nr:hypothetical protein LIA77_10190 [Sarocladium implicatum]
MSLKDRISSPLEAGTSILDAHQLPPPLVTALEHSSSRLARRGLHITLVVVRRDYQLPHLYQQHQHQQQGSYGLPTPISPDFCQSPPSATSSSASGSRLRFASSLKQLMRSGSLRDVASSAGLTRSNHSLRSNVSSPTFKKYNVPMSPQLGWPLSPVSPKTPSTTTTSTTTDAREQEHLDGFGIRLVHDGSLTPREEKILGLTLSKTAKLYGIGQEWLAPATSPAACGLTRQLIHKSICQNDVLFSSDGLSLVSLDRLYSLKSALSSYSRTKCALRLEDAVDELRRLVLARKGVKVCRVDLLRSFDGLHVTDVAIRDLDQMYRRAYGGRNQAGGIEDMPGPDLSGMSPAAADAASIISSEGSIYGMDEEVGSVMGDVMEVGVALTTATPVEEPAPVQPPEPKPPLLKLQTTFPVKPKPIRAEATSNNSKPQEPTVPAEKAKNAEEDGERTARPAEELPIMFQPWGMSIGEMLSADVLSPQRCSMGFGPMTPNGYDDISPITRGEWGFLMVDDKFQGAKTVRVETC